MSRGYHLDPPPRLVALASLERKNRKQIATRNIGHQNIPSRFEFVPVVTVKIGL